MNKNVKNDRETIKMKAEDNQKPESYSIFARSDETGDELLLKSFAMVEPDYHDFMCERLVSMYSRLMDFAPSNLQNIFEINAPGYSGKTTLVEHLSSIDLRDLKDYNLRFLSPIRGKKPYFFLENKDGSMIDFFCDVDWSFGNAAKLNTITNICTNIRQLDDVFSVLESLVSDSEYQNVKARLWLVGYSLGTYIKTHFHGIYSHIHSTIPHTLICLTGSNPVWTYRSIDVSERSEQRDLASEHYRLKLLDLKNVYDKTYLFDEGYTSVSHVVESLLGFDI